MKHWLSFILVLLALAASGMTRDQVPFDDWIEITQRTGAMTDTPFLYNGAYGVVTDPNGLLYMQARYYNPTIRRFINADPSGFSGGMNFYAYADGNPVSMMDPSGMGATSADRNDQIRDDFMSAYNQMQAQTAAIWYTGVQGGSAPPMTGWQMIDSALSFTPGGDWVKAFYTSSTGKELGSGEWSQRSSGEVLMQGLVGAATLAPVFPAAGKALGAIKAEAQISAAIRFELGSAQRMTMEAAEYELGSELASLGKRKDIATVVGAVDPYTGATVAGRSYKGYCAERSAADLLGVGDKRIRFTMPVRPRTGELVRVCKECQKRFDRSQFPEGTKFK